MEFDELVYETPEDGPVYFRRPNAEEKQRLLTAFWAMRDERTQAAVAALWELLATFAVAPDEIVTMYADAARPSIPPGTPMEAMGDRALWLGMTVEGQRPGTLAALVGLLADLPPGFGAGLHFTDAGPVPAA